MLLMTKPTSSVYKPKRGDTIRFIEYDKISAFEPIERTNAIFLRWQDTQNIVVSIDGVEKVISAEYLI